MKSLRSMLQGSQLIAGLTTQHVTSPWLAKVWQYSGCDFVYIEYEHVFLTRRSLPIPRFRGLPVVAKVPECSRTCVGKRQEAGLTGIQLPWTETKQLSRSVQNNKLTSAGL